MKTKAFVMPAALLACSFSLAACAAAPDEPETSDENTRTTSEALMQPPTEQICCNDISGWGSVVYYQQWAGYTWVTTETHYHQGGGCPGTSGTCKPIAPVPAPP